MLPSIGNEVLKATVAEFDAADLIIQREVVSAKVTLSAQVPHVSSITTVRNRWRMR